MLRPNIHLKLNYPLIFRGLRPDVTSPYSPLSPSSLSAQLVQPGDNAMPTNELGAYYKDYLRLHLPAFIYGSCTSHVAEKIRDILQHLKLSNIVDKDSYDNLIIKFYRAQMSTEEENYLNDENLHESNDELCTVRLKNLMCQALSEPNNTDSLSLLRKIIDSDYWMKPELSCGDDSWDAFLKLSWATFRASILALKFVKKKIISDDEIKNILIHVRFRCFHSTDEELKALQWRTGGTEKLMTEPAPSAKKGSIPSTPVVNTGKSWSIIFCQDKKLNDLVVVGPEDCVIARLEKLVDCALSDRQIAEFQPYLHFSTKTRDKKDLLKAAKAHSIPIGEHPYVTSLPADCALMRIAASKVNRLVILSQYNDSLLTIDDRTKKNPPKP